MIEDRFGQVADVQSQPLRLSAVLDDKLQQDESLAGITEVRSGIEMNMQLLVRLDEPEIAKASGVIQTHARRDLFPARIVGQIFIRTVFIGEERIGAIRGKRVIKIIL